MIQWAQRILHFNLNHDMLEEMKMDDMRDKRFADDLADKEAQYDAAAKNILSNKEILASLLIETVDDFKGMSMEEVVPLIRMKSEPQHEGVDSADGYVSEINPNSGAYGEKMTGFDFLLSTKAGRIFDTAIVDIEAQKGKLFYDPMNRAVFYVGRLIST